MIDGRATVLVLALAAAACAGSAVPPAAPPHGPNRWASLDFTERHARMTWVLLPTLSRKLWAFERKEYPTLACATCHGRDAEARGFAMPSALPPLDPAHMPDADEPMVRFMRDVIVPTTDRLLEAGGTIDCWSCHPRGPHV